MLIRIEGSWKEILLAHSTETIRDEEKKYVINLCDIPFRHDINGMHECHENTDPF